MSERQSAERKDGFQMNGFDAKKARVYLDGVASDEWMGRRHSDGSKCEAESAETCPKEQHAQKADEIPTTVSSSSSGAGSTGSKKPLDYLGDLDEDDYKAVMSGFDSLLDGAGVTFGSLDSAYGDGEYLEFGATYKFTQGLSEGVPEVGKNADGELSIVTKLTPEDCSRQVSNDMKAVGKAIGESGLVVRENRWTGGPDDDGYEDGTIRRERSVGGVSSGSGYVVDRAEEFDFEVGDAGKWRAFIDSRRASRAG